MKYFTVFTYLIWIISDYEPITLIHYQTKNFRLLQTERIWRKWQKVIQTGRKVVGKGEIAHNEQFPLLPQCFQKACFPEASKGIIVWEWGKFFANQLNFRFDQIECMSSPQNKFAQMKISLCGKVANIAGYHHLSYSYNILSFLFQSC